MPRRKRSASPFDDDMDEDASSNSLDQPPMQRNAANARERARMRVLSSAFCRLKTKLPNIPADTKLSKLDTLRLATIYIKQLKGIVDGDEVSTTSESFHFQPPLTNTTWPFTFQNIQSYRQTPVTNSHYSPEHASWPSPPESVKSNKYSNDMYTHEGISHNYNINHNNNNNNISNCNYGNYPQMTHIPHTHHLQHQQGHSIH